MVDIFTSQDFLLELTETLMPQKSLAARYEGPSPQAGEEGKRVLNGWWAGLPEYNYWTIHSDMGFTGPSQGVDMQWQESQIVVMYAVWEATAL